MFITTLSKAGLGMYMVILSQALNYLFKTQIQANDLLEAVYTILVGIGAVLWIIGQILRKDLSFGIWRKN